ncbi:MAG: helix-turn-helix domain-containing protein [Desulforhopalus sp.]
MSGCESKTAQTGDDAKTVLEALAKCEKPCGAKDIAEATGLDKKNVSNKITALKKKGLVDSPVRCKYGITDEGRASL